MYKENFISVFKPNSWCSLHLLLRSDIHNIIPPNKNIPEFTLQLSTLILFTLLHSDVHVAVEAGEDSFVFSGGGEGDGDGATEDCVEEF